MTILISCADGQLKVLCPGCGKTPLSRYNRGLLCYCCQDKLELSPAATSSQQYLVLLRYTLGYENEREPRRLREKAGDVQVRRISGDIQITYYPPGGVQSLPVAQGTVSVTGEHLQAIHLSGAYPKVKVDISPQCSAKPCLLLCHLKP